MGFITVRVIEGHFDIAEVMVEIEGLGVGLNQYRFKALVGKPTFALIEELGAETLIAIIFINDNDAQAGALFRPKVKVCVSDDICIVIEDEVNMVFMFECLCVGVGNRFKEVFLSEVAHRGPFFIS